MINVSEAYRQACESNNRVSYVIAKYGLYDKKAKGNISSVESESQPFSNLNKTYNEIKDTNYNYISCEPNRVGFNNNFYFISDKNKSNQSENLAYWSSELSNEDRTFTTNPRIVYKFNQDINFTEISLYFQEICDSFVINYYYKDSLVATREVRNNISLTPTTQGTSMLSDTYFDKLEIVFVKTGEPYRYIKFNEIDFGVIQTFTNKQIVDFDIIDELSIDSSELTSNSLNLSIDNSSGDYDILNPNNKLSLLQEKQEISLYHYLKVGERFQELPLGTFLLKEFQVENQTLEIEAYDDIYYMNKIYYGSKFYDNVNINIILEDLFNYFNYTNYIIDEELQDITLTGYIPRVEFREALRLIAEASSCVVSKTRYGVTYIYKTYDPVTKTFNRNMIFQENPSRNMFNNVIDVVEYNYSIREENVEIYNAKLSVGEHTLLFSRMPVIETTIIKANENSNYEITNYSSTSCVVNVKQETEVVLKATIVSEQSSTRRFNKNKIVSYDEYAINKVDNNLITESNSQEIANWKLNRSEIKYNFDTLVMPYIEVGDTCNYKTRFNTTNVFIPTRLEFTKSIIENIEGE